MSFSLYEKKNFTLSLEQMPDAPLLILHVKKGKDHFETCLTEAEAELLTKTFEFIIEPPIYEEIK